ncbi:MAG: DUF1415 domain-containing protein [Pseudomonadales bacterium]
MDDVVIQMTERWVQRFVVDLNLCPFARREIEGGRVRYAVTEARSEAELLAALDSEMQTLDAQPEIATTLLIHSWVLTDFFSFNQFLDEVDRLLISTRREGIYQVASFHPQYQYAHTQVDDPENFANRSPYAMLHILREADVSAAVAAHPDTSAIPATNLTTLNALGAAKLEQMWQAVRDDSSND